MSRKHFVTAADRDLRARREWVGRSRTHPDGRVGIVIDIEVIGGAIELTISGERSCWTERV